MTPADKPIGLLDLNEMKAVAAKATPLPWKRPHNHYGLVTGDQFVCDTENGSKSTAAITADANYIVLACNAMPALIAELEAAKPPASPEGWQDMASAPKDGTWLIGHRSDGTVFRISWGRARDNSLGWCSVNRKHFEDEFDGWIACPQLAAAPAPPGASPQKEGETTIAAELEILRENIGRD